LKISQFIGILGLATSRFLFMENDQKGKVWWQPAIVMFAKVSVWVAIPIILALFIGKYFDKRYGTDPWIFISLTGIAFIVSIFGIWKMLKKYIKEMNLEERNKNQEKNGESN
jgi:F0F1-type ATP synthase assembly protein I